MLHPRRGDERLTRPDLAYGAAGLLHARVPLFDEDHLPTLVAVPVGAGARLEAVAQHSNVVRRMPGHFSDEILRIGLRRRSRLLPGLTPHDGGKAHEYQH